MASSLLLLFLSIFLQIFTIFGLSSSNPLILSLKTQDIPHHRHSRPFQKPSSASQNVVVPFYHNVTLTVALSAGNPPQPVTMVLDTGSELSYFHCPKSASFNSTFAPNLSSSYRPAPCLSTLCRVQARNLDPPATCDPGTRLCHAALSYADGSSIEGNLAQDTLAIAGSSFPGTVFGCMDTGYSSDPGEEAKTTGLLGMNRGSLSFVTQTRLGKFSYCISDRDSSGVLLFGDARFPWLNSLNYTPMVQIAGRLPYFNRVAYTVQLEGIRVGREALRVEKSLLAPDHTGAGQTMVDSGTQFTFLLGPVYKALKAEFLNQTLGLLEPLKEPGFVFQGAMDACFQVGPTRRGMADLPRVTLVFLGAEMSVAGERLLYRVPGETRGPDSVYCLTFGNSDLLGVEAYLIGHHHQQNLWLEFDLAKSRVGFAEVRCDIASQRLGLGL